MLKLTIRDIASQLQISPSTVSKALSGKPEVNESTRARVVDYAQSLGYIPANGRNSAAKSVRVAIVIEDVDEPNAGFFYEILVGFKHYAKQRDFEVIILTLTTAEQLDRDYDDYVHDNQIDGVFVMGLRVSDPYCKQLATTAVPSVALDIFTGNPATGSVGVNNVLGVRLAIEHLASLGHRSIGFVNGHSDAYVSQERLLGFYGAMHLLGMTWDPSWIFEGDYTERGGASAADYFASKAVTALFFASDLMACGALRRFRELGISVPGRFSVVGFDNAPICTVCSPPLTTVAQDRFQVGKTACALLDGLMRSVPINHVVLPPSLVVRNSTAQLSGKL